MVIDLQPFCSTDEARPYFHKPFTRGEWTFATDGRVLVRVPAISSIPDNDGTPLTVSLQGVLNAARELPDQPLPNYPMPTDEDMLEVCMDCDGDGKRHQCRDCQCKCERCGGSGKVVSIDSFSADIASKPFALTYLRLLQSLHDVWVPSKMADVKKPLAFKFEGGTGVLMGLSEQRIKHIKPIKTKASRKVAANT